MAIHGGYWSVCQTCGFPIRLPNSKKWPDGPSNRQRRVLLACPVCLNVHTFDPKKLEAVRFRIPDPFRAHSAILYRVVFRCGKRSCSSKADIRAMAAAETSVAELLGIWRFWNLHVRCSDGHGFRVPSLATWVITH